MSESYVSLARRIQADPSIIDTDAMPEIPPYSDEVGAINAYRPELYALLAITVNKVVDTTLEDRVNHPPFGLTDGLGTVKAVHGTMQDLKLLLNTTLQAKKRETLEAMRESELNPIVERLDVLVELFESLYVDSGRYEDLEALIGGGVSTATRVTASGLALVARLTRRVNPDITNGQIAAFARRRNFVRKVAGINIDHLPFATSLLEETALYPPTPASLLQPDALAIVGSPSGDQVVDFIQPIKDIRDPDSNLTIDELVPCQVKTLGCPASARLNGDSAVNKLWGWAVDLAEQTEIF